MTEPRKCAACAGGGCRPPPASWEDVREHFRARIRSANFESRSADERSFLQPWTAHPARLLDKIEAELRKNGGLNPSGEGCFWQRAHKQIRFVIMRRIDPEHTMLVYRLIEAQLGRKALDQPTREDLAHDLFLRVLKTIEQSHDPLRGPWWRYARFIMAREIRGHFKEQAEDLLRMVDADPSAADLGEVASDDTSSVEEQISTKQLVHLAVYDGLAWLWESGRQDEALLIQILLDNHYDLKDRQLAHLVAERGGYRSKRRRNTTPNAHQVRSLRQKAHHDLRRFLNRKLGEGAS